MIERVNPPPLDPIPDSAGEVAHQRRICRLARSYFSPDGGHESELEQLAQAVREWQAFVDRRRKLAQDT